MRRDKICSLAGKKQDNELLLKSKVLLALSLYRIIPSKSVGCYLANKYQFPKMLQSDKTGK